ncbi:hypothetical protein TNIN_130841 [Trichonephila inaurata madagascariensis]|uniref:Uncharacterized protein n=1 Tax=Trichonephila inaurata madagascariensis TaxID=2747483 RepID=A0A8X6IJZ2_9ARAC|nr:hypothetical protein TNIN_130841 [Trichonephila inaurata madagascariensis]
MRTTDLRLLCEIPVPFPDPFTCKACYNPDCLRKQGIFASNGGYIRHLRNFHGVDPSKDVVYFCPVCMFKGTVKRVKSHRCPGPNAMLNLSGTDPSDPLSKIDPVSTTPRLSSEMEPPVSSSAFPLPSTSSREDRDPSLDLDYFPDNQQALPSRPDEFLAAINSAMNDFDGSRPLCLDGFLDLSISTPGPSPATVCAASSRPPWLEGFIPSDDEPISQDARRLLPQFSTVSLHPILTFCLVILWLGEHLARMTPPYVIFPLSCRGC